MAEAGRLEALCGTLNAPAPDAQDQELQAWPQCTAAQLLVSSKPAREGCRSWRPNSAPRECSGSGPLFTSQLLQECGQGPHHCVSISQRPWQIESLYKAYEILLEHQQYRVRCRKSMRTWPCKRGPTRMACTDRVWQDAPQMPSTLRMSEASDPIPGFLVSQEQDFNAGRDPADKCSALMVSIPPPRRMHANLLSHERAPVLCRRTHHPNVARQRLEARLRLHINRSCETFLHRKCAARRAH